MDAFLPQFESSVVNPAYVAVKTGIENGICAHFSSESRHGLTSTAAQRFCVSFANAAFWQQDDALHQAVSAFLYLLITTAIAYFILGALFYYLNFDLSSAKQDPKFRTDQAWREIPCSLLSILVMSFFTAPIVLAQAHGYSKIYKFGQAPLWYEGMQVILFLAFNDTAVYWLHRAFHTPFLFRWMHKKHHQFVTPTPFAAFAFDPVEAMIMSLPIYGFSFILPMSDIIQLFVFMAAFIWTLLIHDDSSQFHTVHHKNISLNFGQYTILWDRWAGTYMDSDVFFADAQRRDKHNGLAPKANGNRHDQQKK